MKEAGYNSLVGVSPCIQMKRLCLITDKFADWIAEHPQKLEGKCYDVIFRITPMFWSVSK